MYKLFLIALLLPACLGNPTDVVCKDTSVLSCMGVTDMDTCHVAYETEGRIHHDPTNTGPRPDDCITNKCVWNAASNSCHSGGRCLYLNPSGVGERDCTSRNG